jgi:hypothetical protein
MSETNNPIETKEPTAGRPAVPERIYSDVEIDAIAREVAKTGTHPNHVYLDGVEVPIDWDDDKYISENLYEDFLRAVQTDRRNAATGEPYTKESRFEDYLRDCLNNLSLRREELKVEREKQYIDQRTYQNATMVAELAEGAIIKYLEKSDTGRLIGV